MNIMSARCSGRACSPSPRPRMRWKRPPAAMGNTMRTLMEVSGGAGPTGGFGQDGANPENTRRSWDMVARYVIPEINGHIAKLRESQKILIDNIAVVELTGQSVMT